MRNILHRMFYFKRKTWEKKLLINVCKHFCADSHWRFYTDLYSFKKFIFTSCQVENHFEHDPQLHQHQHSFCSLLFYTHNIFAFPLRVFWFEHAVWYEELFMRNIFGLFWLMRQNDIKMKICFNEAFLRNTGTFFCTIFFEEFDKLNLNKVHGEIQRIAH